MTKPGVEKLRLFLRSVYLKGHQDGNLKTADMSWEDKILKDIRQLLLESLGKKKYLIDNLPLTKDEGYLDKCVQAKDMVDGYNTARQEDIDVINKLCGGDK